MLGCLAGIFLAQFLDLLQDLPTAVVASDSEVLLLIEQGKLIGRGIGTVDAHLLAAASLSRCGLWSQDRRLAALAQEQGLAVAEDGSA